jgi:hypothetical protein
MAKKSTKLENPAEKARKMPTFEERYEESLIRKLFEEELKKKEEEILAEEECEYFEETRQFEHNKREGD